MHYVTCFRSVLEVAGESTGRRRRFHNNHTLLHERNRLGMAAPWPLKLGNAFTNRREDVARGWHDGRRPSLVTAWQLRLVDGRRALWAGVLVSRRCR